MSEPEPRFADSEDQAAASCTECQSQEVRPSRSSYPQDKERTGGAGSFWRCSNCGTRFLGPRTHGPKPRRRSSPKGSKDSLEKTINFWRRAKRWLFPILAILTTVAVVIYILDSREPEPEEIVFPS